MTLLLSTTSVTATGPSGECSSPLPPPPSPVTDAADWPPDKIHCTQCFDHCTQCFDLEETFIPPLKAGDDEEWLCWLVPIQYMDGHDSAWAKAINSYSSAHVAYVVGRASRDGFYVVAVASCLVPYIDGFGPRTHRVFDIDIPTSVWEPSKGEINSHGVVEATRMSKVAFATKAAECVLSGRPKGLVWFFRNITDKEHKHLLAPMEWIVLLQEILTAGVDVAKNFVKLCRFLGLLLLERVPSVSTESVNALLGRTDEAWMAIFQTVTRVSALSSEEDMREKMHQMSLLCAPFKMAGGETNGFQQIDGGQSANKNLADLGILLHIDAEPAPLSIGGSDAKYAKTLVREQLACMSNLEPELKYFLYGAVPVGFMGVVDQYLPEDLLNNLPHETVLSCLRLCHQRYSVLPELQRPENTLPLFLYAWGRTQVRHPYMNIWMTSKEGRRRYGQIKKRLCETDSGDDMALCLLALVYYGRVLDRTEGIATPHGSFLEDFICHLEDDSGDVQRAMWEGMAFSLRRVAAGVGVSWNVRVWLETIPGKSPDCLTDCFSDRYWEARLTLRYSHNASCERVAEEVRPLVDAGRALLLRLNKREQGVGNR